MYSTICNLTSFAFRQRVFCRAVLTLLVVLPTWQVCLSPNALAKPAKLTVAQVESRAVTAYEKGKFAVAAQHFVDAVLLAPDRRDLVLAAALAFERAEQFEKAIQYCQEFIDKPGAYVASLEKARLRLEFLKKANAQGGVPVLFESADGVQLFVEQVGATSIGEVLSWPTSKFGGAIKKEREQEDTRPHLAMYRAKPDAGRPFLLWLYFHKNKLYRIGRDFPCTRAQVDDVVARSPSAYGKDLLGGNKLVEVKLGKLVERIILPVGERPKCEWWLYDLKMDRDLYKKELAVFEAYGWNDAGVKALEPPANFAKADELFGNALKAMPNYSAAASRWCAAILESGNRDAAHAREVCSIPLRSTHKVYKNRAKRALATIQTW